MTDKKVSDTPNNENSPMGINLYDVLVTDADNVHLGNEIQYYGPMQVQQYVTGLPRELANNPEVGQGLAKAGLHFAASCSSTTGQSSRDHQPVILLLPSGRKRYPVWLLYGVGVILFILIVVTVTLIIISKNDIVQIVLPTDAPDDASPPEDAYNPFLPTLGQQVTLSGKLRIIERREWLGQPRNYTLNSFKVNFVLIMETGGDFCPTEALCKLQILQTQTNDIQVLHLYDIAPNFLLGGDGYAYEGRNWNAPNQCSLNETFDINSICISFIGQFSTKNPSVKQLLAVKQLIDQAVSLEKLEQNYSMYAVKQINPNINSPGQNLFTVMQKWPNWKAQV